MTGEKRRVGPIIQHMRDAIRRLATYDGSIRGRPEEAWMDLIVIDTMARKEAATV